MQLLMLYSYAVLMQSSLASFFSSLLSPDPATSVVCEGGKKKAPNNKFYCLSRVGQKKKLRLLSITTW